jgi:hypothetical protein
MLVAISIVVVIVVIVAIALSSGSSDTEVPGVVNGGTSAQQASSAGSSPATQYSTSPASTTQIVPITNGASPATQAANSTPIPSTNTINDPTNAATPATSIARVSPSAAAPLATSWIYSEPADRTMVACPNSLPIKFAFARTYAIDDKNDCRTPPPQSYIDNIKKMFTGASSQVVGTALLNNPDACPGKVKTYVGVAGCGRDDLTLHTFGFNEWDNAAARTFSCPANMKIKVLQGKVGAPNAKCPLVDATQYFAGLADGNNQYTFDANLAMATSTDTCPGHVKAAHLAMQCW